MNTFKKLGVTGNLLERFEELEFTVPTEIQEKTIPLILEGRDVIGNAATGSGKTLAFATGILKKISPEKQVQALILTPTRELAIQIAEVINDLRDPTKHTITEIYGGVDIRRQMRKIKESQIIVGTPGRLVDHLTRQSLDLSHLKILVLDEADRMIDMGFIRDVEKIMYACNKDRQTLLFSATTSADIERVEKKHLKNPIFIKATTSVDPLKLRQSYYDVSRNQKFSLLVHLLEEEGSGIVIVFCNTRRTVDLVAKNLLKQGVSCHAIHGGLEQNKRTKIIKEFHKNKAEILVCTNVAARGLDIKGVTHVYNYDAPKDPEEYIHRIGRTARAGEGGEAISLIAETDYENFNNIHQHYEVDVKRKEIPQMKKIFFDTGKRKSFSRNDRSRGRRPQRDYSRRR